MSPTKRAELDFIMGLRKKGKTYEQIAEAFGKKFGIKKTGDSISGLYTRHKEEYDLASLKNKPELKKELMRSKILNEFLELVEERKYVPSKKEFFDNAETDRNAVARYFGSLDGIIEEARAINPEVFEHIIDESAFNESNFKQLKSYIQKYDRFVVTTAVTGCEPHEEALASIRTYCKHNNAGLLIIPCSDPAKEHNHEWSLSHKLPKESIVFRDLNLNDNLLISTIKMSAKQLKPLTGLKRIGQRNGSSIFASPKQFLEFTANSNNNTDIPRALMTSGAITIAEYRPQKYMGERTSYLATSDHTLGGIIVEIKNDRVFFFRQFQFEARTGSFCDLDKKYNPNGKVEKITAELVQLADYHVLSTDPVVKKMSKDVVDLVRPDIMTLEDFFDGITINPHERHNVVSLSKKAKGGLLSLDHELQSNKDEIDDLSKWNVKKLVFKYGNHEDFLKRWLCDGEFMNEPQNKLLGMKLTLALEEEGIPPFEYAMRKLYGLEQPEKITFLRLNDSFKVNGIENGAHGHLGKAGRRNPALSEIEECYGAANVGHNHSAGIFRSVYRVGTLTHLQLSYNDGPSAWTQTILIQHRDGSRQLINNIYGEWKLKD